MDKLSNREYLYRSAFELGRHLVGYEVQKALAAIDWYSSDPTDHVPIGIIGWGEGGMLALYAAAVDQRVQSVCVSGYFADRRGIWREPIDRNVFGLLEQFGDAELASMIVPRRLIVEASRALEVTIPGGRGAPARIVTPDVSEVRQEVARSHELVKSLAGAAECIELVESEGGRGNHASDQALETFLSAMYLELPPRGSVEPLATGDYPLNTAERHDRQFREMDQHNQRILAESAKVRGEFMEGLQTDSLEAYTASLEKYRQVFYDDVIGRFDLPLLPPDVRSRQTYDRERWVGHEVVMDVFPDVIAYGLLLLPKDLTPNERRPVVVCQHGLEGRPQDLIGEAGYRAYKAFAAQLAERGYITFAPQNLYIFRDRFRTLQRKANPLKKTLFSVIVPQHQQILNWLKTLPFVDTERVALYGLSYGGKTAMRVPPLVTDYCLSICSADFNEWVDKNASTRNPHSYVFTGEYEIFEFDLGSTFNYAEMAALIAPRPFMVERGHFDGVASDETVGWEFAKVRFLYAAKLGIADRCEIEWFAGPHTINGQGTFDFLKRHLAWPSRR
jgi:dienelactone hydrolase